MCQKIKRMSEGINVLLGSSEAELIEKKSRFIAQIEEIHSEDEALEIISQTRKKYFDARHICFAYVLGAGNEIMRFSDDKEPSGTAGKPILDVITSNNLHNCLITVTRYFGGILLGTGGLTRAYSGSAALSVSKAKENQNILDLMNGERINITCDYTSAGKIQYILGSENIGIINTIYEEKVSFVIAVESSKIESIRNKITEATAASAIFETVGGISFVKSDNQIRLYDL